MEEPLTPREFLSRYNLPQLVRIHEAHRVSLDSTISSSNCSDYLKRLSSTFNSLTVNSTQKDSSSQSCSSSTASSTMTSDSSVDRSDSSGVGGMMMKKSSLKERRKKGFHVKRRKLNEKNNNNIINNNHHHHNPNRSNLNHQSTHLNGLNNKLTPVTSTRLTPASAGKRSSCIRTIFNEPHEQENHPQDVNQLHPMTKESANCELNLDQPFLLYKAYTSRQVIGYTVSPDSICDSNYYKKIGPNLLIPEGYQGWFSLVNSKGHTAGYFSSIDEVGRAQVHHFLTRDAIKGYKAPRFAVLAETPNRITSLITVKGSSSYEPITIEGGTVLRLVGVYEDISAFILSSSSPAKSSLSSLRFKKNLPIPMAPGPRYAKCIKFGSIPGGEIVFIPITETGRFYVMAKRSSEPSYNHVYSFSQLLRIVQLPVTVQLVTGPKPRNYPDEEIFQSPPSTNFSAVLRLEEIRVRDVILGCTLRPPAKTSERSGTFSSIRRTWRGNKSNGSRVEEKPTLLEFDLDSGFSFYRTFVERNGTLSSRKIPELVIQSVGHCDVEADSWRRQIKLAHDVVTKDCDTSDLGDCNSSQRVNEGPALPSYRKTRKSLFDSGVIPDSLATCNEIDKRASIGSRASSGVSTVSRLSRIIQKFWSPLKRGSTVSGFRHKYDRDLDLVEFDDIEEDVNGEENTKSPLNGERVKEIKLKAVDQHHYETLKKSDEIKYFPPKQKLTRKQTLDVIFTETEASPEDKKRSAKMSSTLSLDDEPAYSTIE